MERCYVMCTRIAEVGLVARSGVALVFDAGHDGVCLCSDVLRYIVMKCCRVDD